MFGFDITQRVLLNGLSGKEFLVLAVEAMTRLGWRLDSAGLWGIRAYTPMTPEGRSELIEAVILNQTVTFRSASMGYRLFGGRYNRANLMRLMEAIREEWKNTSAEELEHLWEEMRPRFKGREMKEPTRPLRMFNSPVEIFAPRGSYFVTPIILALNVLVYLAMVAAGVDFEYADLEALVNWGANYAPLTSNGHWGRLLTAVFLHGGFFHLMGNMGALVYIGFLLERALGRTKYALVYLLTGLAASYASMSVNEVPSVGASGAIYGLYGAFFALLLGKVIEEGRKKFMLPSIGVFLLYGLITSLQPGVDAAAHVGGLLSGLVLGFAAQPLLKREETVVFRRVSVAGISLVLVLGLAFSGGSWEEVEDDFVFDWEALEEVMDRFNSYESMALEPYNSNNYSSKEDRLNDIRDRGIYYWKEALKAMQETDELNLPKETMALTAKAREYCRKRIECYELFYTLVEQDADLSGMDDCNAATEELLMQIEDLRY